VRFAARDLGVDELEALLTGPTAIAFVRGDTAAVAKTLRDYARTNQNLVVKGGLLGRKVLNAADVQALADLPSRDVLLAQLAGAFQAPLTKLAGLLQALPRNFAYGLKALIDERGGVPSTTSGSDTPSTTSESDTPSTTFESDTPSARPDDNAPSAASEPNAPSAAPEPEAADATPSATDDTNDTNSPAAQDTEH
jgi:large subunit ribosomal protein L10